MPVRCLLCREFVRNNKQPCDNRNCNGQYNANVQVIHWLQECTPKDIVHHRACANTAKEEYIAGYDLFIACQRNLPVNIDKFIATQDIPVVSCEKCLAIYYKLHPKPEISSEEIISPKNNYDLSPEELSQIFDPKAELPESFLNKLDP